MAGLGPAPFCAMLFADMGAHVVRIARPGAAAARSTDVLARGRPTLEVDLRAPGGAATVLELAASADVLIEGFRPGVMERLGLGPDVCLAVRPQLVYGRMTGWGQDGPLAHSAGHDINYIALSGALHAMGSRDRPPSPPLNLVGDFGGGAMVLAFGLVAALLESRSSGQGQVVDAAMTDGAALLSAMIYGMHGAGRWSLEREDNMLDGAAPYYCTYECADGKYLAVGAIEPPFYALMMELCAVDDPLLRGQQNERSEWAVMRSRLATLFRSRTREEWCGLLEGTDACVTPVLDWEEAPRHPHNVARATFVELDGIVQPGAVPRFSRTPGAAKPAERKDADRILQEWRSFPVGGAEGSVPGD